MESEKKEQKIVFNCLVIKPWLDTFALYLLLNINILTKHVFTHREETGVV